MNTRPWLAALALLVMIAGCSQGGSAQQAPVDGDAVAVTDNAFTPEALQVSPGITVTWTWEGSSPHNVTFDDAASDTQTDGTWTQSFAEPGTYDYVCTLHSGMTGTVIVE